MAEIAAWTVDDATVTQDAVTSTDTGSGPQWTRRVNVSGVSDSSSGVTFQILLEGSGAFPALPVDVTDHVKITIETL